MLGACSRGPTDFSQEVRVPSDQGVVTSINFTQVELDGKRRYSISSEVQSFSTYNGEVTPLLAWEKKYVHLGLEDDTVMWFAGIGVLDRTADPPVVFYANGLVEDIDGEGRLVFADGTVLEPAEGLELPPEGARVTAKIDTEKHLIAEFPPTQE
ncbi:MAG: hypothetical protein ACRDI1_04690 [Actinomycetota bacterium]